MKTSISRWFFAVSCLALAAQAGAVRLGEFEFEALRLGLGDGGDYAAAADVNGDGRPDLLATRRDAGELACFPSEGGDGFGRAVRTDAGNEPVGLAAADFDGDGRTDVAVANHETDHLTLLLGDGRCGFTEAPGSPLRLRVRPHVHAVASADLDGDGHRDLVVDAREDEGLLVLPGLGGGRFDTDGVHVPMGGDPYRGMAVADINGDGRPDLVTPGPRGIAIALAAGSKRFGFERVRPVDADTPFGVAVGDFDGDGRADLLSGSGQSSGAVQVFLGRGNGSFDEHPDSPFAYEPGAKSVAVADFNDDGMSDAVVASYDAAEVLVLMGDRRRLEAVRLPGFAHPWGLAAADFNRDGYDDLAVVDQGGAEAVVFMSRHGR